MTDNLSEPQQAEEQLNTEAENLAASAPKKKKSDLGLRTGVGFLYIAVLLAFFLLKIFINDFLFDIVIFAFSVIGTLEMVRAFRGRITKAQAAIVMVFTTLTILTFCVSDYVFKEVLDVVWGESNYTPLITLVVFIAGLAVLLGLLAFAHQQTSLESVGYSLIAYVYPLVFLLILAGCNHFYVPAGSENFSDISILLIFVICPFVDCDALLFGLFFGKKCPKKLAPVVSPKKTVIGAVGGLIGGAIGAFMVFIGYYGLCVPFRAIGTGTAAAEAFGAVVFRWDRLYLFLVVGVISSVFSQFGDLVESAIKRKLGIKDMGKMLPGHGGILDRIDSSLYAGLAVCLIFTIVIMVMMS